MDISSTCTLIIIDILHSTSNPFMSPEIKSRALRPYYYFVAPIFHFCNLIPSVKHGYLLLTV